MKFNTYSLAILVTLSAQAGMATFAQATEYTVDKDHSHVGFMIRHLVGKVPGSFKDFEGAFNFDEKKPESFKGKFEIKTASVDTANEKRDGHLKSADFFDSEKFPTMTFESKKAHSKGDKKFTVDGDLTLHGVTKPVTLEVEYTGTQKDPYGNTKAGFSASTKLNRKDFGIVWNKTLDTGGTILGEDVKVDLDIEATAKIADAAKKK